MAVCMAFPAIWAILIPFGWKMVRDPENSLKFGRFETGLKLIGKLLKTRMGWKQSIQSGNHGVVFFFCQFWLR